MPKSPQTADTKTIVAEAVEQAVTMHRGGWLDEAERIYREILKVSPDHFDALHLLGILNHQYGRSDEALRLLDQALKIDPKSAPAWSNRGVVLDAKGSCAEALTCFDKAVALSPGYADAHSNRGNALRSLGKIDEAVAAFGAALSVQPDHVDALANRAGVLIALERFDDAKRDLDRALTLASGHAVANCNHAELKLAEENAAAALESYERAVRANGRLASAVAGRAQVLIDLDRLEEALAGLDGADPAISNHAAVLTARADALDRIGRLNEAAACYERVLAADPQHVVARNNIARTLCKLDRAEDALPHLEFALRFAPRLPDLNFNAALTKLYLGDYESGWKQYEWRWNKKDLKPHRRPFQQPLWLGDADLTGKTLLLHAEQGFGDTLQFIRYVDVLASHCAKLVLEVPPALTALAAASFPDVKIITQGERLPPFDLHAPLLSLPHACRTGVATIPAQVPYLYPPPERVAQWAAVLGTNDLPRIGIAWAGKVTQRHDYSRSIPLAHLAPLIAQADVQFVSLQRELRPGDAEGLSAHGHVLQVADRFADFADTAAVISHLDAVICVDTAVAHLAAGMGKPVWLLLPYGGDWHWVVRGRSDSPWYPTVRLFRQHTPGDWTGAIEAAWAELARFATQVREPTLPQSRLVHLANSGNLASDMRYRNTSLPKSNS